MHAKRVLQRILNGACSWMHAARREALAVGVLAAMRGGRLTVTDLGRSIPTRVSVKHCIKRADRLLANRHLHREGVGVYTALAHLLIANTSRPVMVVDWSDLDASKTHFLLRASLAVKGRALTLYEEVPTQATKEKPKTHAEFLDTLAALLPTGCRPILITDAGFRTPWFREARATGLGLDRADSRSTIGYSSTPKASGYPANRSMGKRQPTRGSWAGCVSPSPAQSIATWSSTRASPKAAAH
jgi:hypothetical protein